MTGFDRYLHDNLLPTLPLAFGVILAGRLVRWVSARYRTALDDEVRASIEAGGVPSERSKRARALAQTGEWLSVSLLYVVFGVIAVRQLGVPLPTLVAPATVIGVALGFGAQQIVGDLLAGFFLFTEHQFGVGDLVRLSMPGQTTGVSGTVEELTLRVTKLRSQQGELIVVPNSALRQVTNLSKDWSRVVLDLPIPVDEDLEKVLALVRDLAEAMAAEPAWHDLIIGDPVMAGVETIEVGYVNLRLLVRTLPGRQFEVGRELRLRVALALRDADVRTPNINLGSGTSS
ncbi:mechanosensitive ion channel family protein [Acidiferrimicrobium sp. IK]|uniref:mechanosensitive ion channel family protein n=1 Tax=Acidiferrimicrobium sp. IK TaxID=2871700 RepID=UPI0021CB6806|nr:mechanosensitive ion channel family protein [Acidiferrimicrobium sp. IK]MCU4185451.1 mechanosensitive ion channel family protein [Acidiferrimicrobium sp. IK]